MAVYEHVAWNELRPDQIVRAVSADAEMDSFDEIDNVPAATVQRVEGDFVWLWDATTQTALPVRGPAYHWYVEFGGREVLKGVDPSELRPGDTVVIWSEKYGGPATEETLRKTERLRFAELSDDTAYFDGKERFGVSLRPVHEFFRVESAPEPGPALPFTRLVVLEVADTRAEDLLRMAIMGWNEKHPGDRIVHRFVYSCSVGDPRDLTR